MILKLFCDNWDSQKLDYAFTHKLAGTSLGKKQLLTL